MQAMTLIYVMAGGAVGSLFRYLTIFFINRLDGSFPYGTMSVNILGSFLMGVWLAVLAAYFPDRGGRELHTLFAVGVLGGFTTFSAFSFDAYLLIERAQYMSAAIYMIGSVIISVAALFAGMALLKAIL